MVKLKFTIEVVEKFTLFTFGKSKHPSSSRPAAQLYLDNERKVLERNASSFINPYFYKDNRIMKRLER